MRFHLLFIKIFFVLGSVWLYVIRPAQVTTVDKIGPAPLIEQAATFTFPKKVETDPEADAVARISGEHRELSLREISSSGAVIKAQEVPPTDSSAIEKSSK